MIYGDFLKSKVPTRKHEVPKVTIDPLQRHLLGLVDRVFALVKGMGTFRGPVSGWLKVARAKVPIDRQAGGGGGKLCQSGQTDEGTSEMTYQHPTPRMGDRPHDPAFYLLTDAYVTTPKVLREDCYICRDMEYARMGLTLCSLCCVCYSEGQEGHIAADEGECDDCGHEQCGDCADVPAQVDPICTCDTPCCSADVGVGVVTCGSQHCPTHGD